MRTNNEEMPELNEPAAEPAYDESGEVDPAFTSGEGPRQINRTSMVLLLVAALGGAGLYFMHMRTGPKTASAAAIESQQAGQAITQFLSGGQSNIKAMEDLLKNTEKVVQKFLTYPSVTQVPLTELQTNPFRMTMAKKDGPPSDAQDKKRKEEERQAALKGVQTLQLQSVIVSGDRKACMINNTMYRESQQVNGFTVESIKTGAVVVRSGSYRFELKMQK
jgi:uncharacterized protein HemX